MKKLVFCCVLTVASVFNAVPAASVEYAFGEVVPGIYVHQGVHEQISRANAGNIGNSGFIVGRDAVAVIDPGGSLAAGQALRNKIESVTGLPISYLILSHFHPDHVIGAAAFSDVPSIIAHAQYARSVVQRSAFYQERFSDLLPDSAVKFVLPTVEVEAQHIVDLGERCLILQAYPTAHTDNDLTITDVKTQTLWASDLVFAQRTPALDGSLRGWLAVLSGVDQSQVKLVIPGHGAPGTWEEIVAPQIAYLENLATFVRKTIDRGASLATMIRESGFENDAGWELYRAQHTTNLTKAYTELEWE